MRINTGPKKAPAFEQSFVNDFGDNYHRTDNEPSSELEREARRIRRRYKNISDYTFANSIYNEYMSILAAKHGGPQLFKLKLKDEMIDEFLPPKPKMKNTQNNRMLLKNKIIIGKANIRRIDYDRLEETLQSLNETSNITELVADEKQRDYVANKILKEGVMKDLSIRKLGAIQSIELLEEYFMSKNKRRTNAKEEEVKQIPVTELLNGKRYDELMDDTTEEDQVIFYRGNYMSRKTVEDLQVYQQLGDLGWDSIKIMKTKGISKKVTQIVKNQNKLNKKEKKKDKKKNKNADGFIMRMIDDNNHDTFSEYEEDMLNFTMDNVFNN